MRLAVRVVGGHLAWGTAESSVEPKGDHRRLTSCPTPSMHKDSRNLLERVCPVFDLRCFRTIPPLRKARFDDFTDDSATFKTRPLRKVASPPRVWRA